MTTVEQARARADDAWDDALLVLRADLAGALAEFREQCAPVVGPEIIRGGEVLYAPRSVPVDPPAHARYRARQVGVQLRLAALAASEVMGRVREAFAPLAGLVFETMKNGVRDD